MPKIRHFEKKMSFTHKKNKKMWNNLHFSYYFSIFAA